MDSNPQIVFRESATSTAATVIRHGLHSWQAVLRKRYASQLRRLFGALCWGNRPKDVLVWLVLDLLRD